MKTRRRALQHWLAAAATASLASPFAWAQSFPTRPITIVVPFPAGGPTDTLGRVLADRMKSSLGQSVIIENLT
jgi:tripartite-type tricarboxylate transporter receptor subunit TctC